MSEFLKNNRRPFDMCVVYEFLQKNSKDLSQFKEKIDLIRGDEEAIYYCILNEYIHHKPIGQAYKSICAILGKDIIDFKEFKNRFEQFKNGSYKFVEKRSTHIFDLKIDDLKIIIGKLDMKSQLILRKVCKPLRLLVDEVKPAIKSLWITLEHDAILCRYHGNSIYYANIDWNPEKMRLCRIDKIIRSANFESIAFNNLLFILKNPKLQLESIRFDDRDGNIYKMSNSLELSSFKSMELIFEQLNHQLSVKRLSIFPVTTEKLFSFLPYLKPGVLEEIGVENGRTMPSPFGTRTEITKLCFISCLEQWKLAQTISLRHVLNCFPTNILSNFKHFELYEFRIWPFTLVPLRDLFAESENFETCHFDTKFGFDVEELEEYLGEPVPSTDEREYVYHYSIENSNKYLEFKLIPYRVSLSIEKKSR